MEKINFSTISNWTIEENRSLWLSEHLHVFLWHIQGNIKIETRWELYEVGATRTKSVGTPPDNNESKMLCAFDENGMKQLNLGNGGKNPEEILSAKKKRNSSRLPVEIRHDHQDCYS